MGRHTQDRSGGFDVVPSTRRRVAVLGGDRIPFARSDGAYADASNQDMFTAVLDGLADRFGLAGERLDLSLIHISEPTRPY